MPLVPYVVEKSGREERVFDIYSRLLKDRIIFLGSGVNDEVANSIVAQMLFLQSEDPKADQLTLFPSDEPRLETDRDLAIARTVDRVRKKFGARGIIPGSLV